MSAFKKGQKADGRFSKPAELNEGKGNANGSADGKNSARSGPTTIRPESAAAAQAVTRAADKPMDSTILVALVDKSYEQRVREYEFYQIILDMMDCHPNFIFPENEMTKH
jgi:hypothetical protein